MGLVWLVDDSDLERQVASRVLAQHHDVHEFREGDGVLARVLRGERPDVLVLDYHLPGASGLEITQQVRQHFAPTELPILMLSSTYTASEDVVAGLEAGANDYVTKPFSDIELRARVDALAQAKLQRQRADVAERSLRKLLQHLPDAFVAIDGHGRISFVNREAERILARDWSELLALPLADVIPELRGVEFGSTPVPAELRIGDRMYEPGLGRLSLGDASGETVTVTLRDVTDKLHAIDRRDRFLAMLAHELRNPLAAVLSATQVIQLSRGVSPEVERAAGVAERQVERLVRIVDDLLDVSRVSRGRIGIHPEPVDVAGAIDRALESARPLIQARRHQVVWERPVGLIVHADPLRFEQMLVNLLTNAAKYSESGGRIEITAAADGDMVEIGVRDQGIGLAPEALEAIFELFVQIDDSLSRSEGGLGIGLPLVRQLATLHGGTIHATSEGRGRGSLFVLRLPRSTVVPVTRSTAPAPRAEGRRILLVDDNEDAVELMRDILISRGHHVQVAHDASEAIALAQREKFEIAFLDIGLPGISGYQLAPQLRAVLAPEPCFLVAVTGYGQPEDVSQARAAGFDEHFVKPVSLAQLEGLIAGLPATPPR